VPHEEALQECMNSSALLIMQGQDCNNQIPAKIYEYFRCQKPIIGLVDQHGDTASIMRKLGYNAIFTMTDVEEIKTGFLEFVLQLKNGDAFVPEREAVVEYSREKQVTNLAKLLDSIT